MRFRLTGHSDTGGIDRIVECEDEQEVRALAAREGIEATTVERLPAPPVAPGPQARPSGQESAAVARQHNLPANLRRGRKAGEPEPARVPTASRVDVDFAVDLLNKGESAESVQGKLVERGVAPEAASGLLNDLAMAAVRRDAADLLNQGHSPEQVRRQLVERGLDQAAASSVVNNILAQRAADTQALLQLLGGVVFAVGVALCLGNVTGAFPTVSYAGFIIMSIGGLIWEGGNLIWEAAEKKKRAAGTGADGGARSCYHCGRSLAGGAPGSRLCGTCRGGSSAGKTSVQKPVASECYLCGKPLATEELASRVCQACRA